MRQRFGAALIVAASLFLGGCYATTEPVLDAGQWADLAGTFECDTMGGRRSEMFSEQKNGVIFPDYTYTDKDQTEMKLKHVAGTLYLLQGRSKKDRSYSYAYVDVVQHDQIVLLMADVMSKGPYIDAMTKKFGVTIVGQTAGGLGVLNGTKSKILEFLMAHDKSLLMAVGNCKRQS